MPSISRVLETSVYVKDLERAAVFYEDVLGLAPVHTTDRMRAYDVQGQSILLLFIEGGTTEAIENEGGTIPPHDASAGMHIAFSCTMEELADWDSRLSTEGVAIEGRMNWMRGGKSIYFRDPDGNLLEIAAGPGLWPGY